MYKSKRANIDDGHLHLGDAANMNNNDADETEDAEERDRS